MPFVSALFVKQSAIVDSAMNVKNNVKRPHVSDEIYFSRVLLLHTYANP